MHGVGGATSYSLELGTKPAVLSRRFSSGEVGYVASEVCSVAEPV